jgi:hypothetical protein
VLEEIDEYILTLFDALSRLTELGVTVVHTKG